MISCGKKVEEKESKFVVDRENETQKEFNPNELLNRAIELDDKLLAKEALRRGANVDLLQKGVSLLCRAIESDKIELATLLLNHKANPNLICHEEQYPLHLAVKKEHFELLKSLLVHEADSTVQDSLKNTPLHLALTQKNTEIASLLIDYATDLSVTNFYGHDPLTIAEGNRMDDLVNKMKKQIERIKRDANLNTLNKLIEVLNHNELKETIKSFPTLLKGPFHYDPILQIINLENPIKAQILLGMMINDFHYKFIPSMDAEENPAIAAIRLDRAELLEVLLTNSIQANFVDQIGKSLLIHAVENNAVNSTKVLVNFGAQNRIEIYRRNLVIDSCLRSRQIKSQIFKEKMNSIQPTPTGRAKQFYRRKISHSLEIINNRKIYKLMKCGFLGIFN